MEIAGTYEIRVRGRLGPEMVHLLADLGPEHFGRSTVLHTANVDQPTLHGTLARLRDLGLDIELIEKVEILP